jgi:hypothetical protein
MALAHVKAAPLVAYFDNKAAACLETIFELHDDVAGHRAVSAQKFRGSPMQIEEPAYKVIDNKVVGDTGDGELE